MFRINNKNTRATSDVSNFDFEQVKVSWVRSSQENNCFQNKDECKKNVYRIDWLMTDVDKFSHGFNIFKNIYVDKFSRINSFLPFKHTQQKLQYDFLGGLIFENWSEHLEIKKFYACLRGIST